MLEFDQFEEVVQIRMGREGGGDMPWGNPGEALYWTAAYLVDGLLVDTGCSYTADELADFLEGKALTLAVNTHYHEDHIGANHVLRERFGIPIFASPLSVPLIRQVPGIHLYQEVVWGYPVPTEVEPVSDTIRTERFSFDVVPTPGHSKDHICLVEPTKGWCFSGDLFVSTEPRSVRPDAEAHSSRDRQAHPVQRAGHRGGGRSRGPQVLHPVSPGPVSEVEAARGAGAVSG